jgi:hypothetical protein
VNQTATDATVPVGERMNGLKLGVGQRRLQGRGEIFPIHELGKIVEKALGLIRRWRNEVCADRSVMATPDPVLAVPNGAGDLGLRNAQLGAMEIDDRLGGDRLAS